MEKIILIAVMFILGQAIPVYAYECEDKNYITVVEADTWINNIRSSDAWGKGSIKASNPMAAKPQEYARTEVYSGNAYVVKAQIFCVDDSIILIERMQYEKNFSDTKYLQIDNGYYLNVFTDNMKKLMLKKGLLK